MSLHNIDQAIERKEHENKDDDVRIAVKEHKSEKVGLFKSLQNKIGAFFKDFADKSLNPQSAPSKALRSPLRDRAQKLRNKALAVSNSSKNLSKWAAKKSQKIIDHTEQMRAGVAIEFSRGVILSERAEDLLYESADFEIQTSKKIAKAERLTKKAVLVSSKLEDAATKIERVAALVEEAQISAKEAEIDEAGKLAVIVVEALAAAAELEFAKFCEEVQPYRL